MPLAREIHPWEVLVEADCDVRVGLVVAQPDVEPRLVLLDEVLLDEQRLGLGLDDERLDTVDHREQVTAGAGARVREMRRDALADRDRLADVDDLPGSVVEQVDTRFVRQFTTAFGGDDRHASESIYARRTRRSLARVAPMGLYHGQQIQGVPGPPGVPESAEAPQSPPRRHRFANACQSPRPLNLTRFQKSRDTQPSADQPRDRANAARRRAARDAAPDRGAERRAQSPARRYQLDHRVRSPTARRCIAPDRLRRAGGAHQRRPVAANPALAARPRATRPASATTTITSSVDCAAPSPMSTAPSVKHPA